LSAAAEVDLELTPDGVANPTLWCAQRLLLRLPLGDRGHVERVVELAVAAGVEPVSVCAGGFEGGGAVGVTGRVIGTTWE
jgi:hypothetical protein